MSSPDDFDDVRRDPDPIRRGGRATKLLTVYQQRSAELARLRHAAIEDAYRERGMSYTQNPGPAGRRAVRSTTLRRRW